MEPANATSRGAADAALKFLRDRCGPELAGLTDNPHLPEPQTAIILEWGAGLRDEDTASAFALDVLEEVLPALTVLWLASFSYSAGSWPQPCGLRRLVDLRMEDLGHVFLLERTLTATARVAIDLHGQAGAALVARTEADKHEKLSRIAEMIARRT